MSHTHLINGNIDNQLEVAYPALFAALLAICLACGLHLLFATDPIMASVGFLAFLGATLSAYGTVMVARETQGWSRVKSKARSYAIVFGLTIIAVSAPSVIFA